MKTASRRSLGDQPAQLTPAPRAPQHGSPAQQTAKGYRETESDRGWFTLSDSVPLYPHLLLPDPAWRAGFRGPAAQSAAAPASAGAAEARPMDAYSKPSSAMRDGSHRLRPSRITGSASVARMRSKSGLRY